MLRLTARTLSGRAVVALGAAVTALAAGAAASRSSEGVSSDGGVPKSKATQGTQSMAISSQMRSSATRLKTPRKSAHFQYDRA